jgi:hypothetical protein
MFTQIVLSSIVPNICTKRDICWARKSCEYRPNSESLGTFSVINPEKTGLLHCRGTKIDIYNNGLTSAGSRQIVLYFMVVIVLFMQGDAKQNLSCKTSP